MPPMKRLRLNYIRGYRKGARLSQEELAILLGMEDAASVSRLERFLHKPSFDTALTLQALFGVDVDQIFAGLTLEKERHLMKRVGVLESRLRRKQLNRKTKRKLELLAQIKARIAARTHDAV